MAGRAELDTSIARMRARVLLRLAGRLGHGVTRDEMTRMVRERSDDEIMRLLERRMLFWVLRLKWRLRP